MGMVSDWKQATDAQIAQLQADPTGLEDLLDGDGDGFYLDKAWHGIHFLLTGTDFGGEGPLASILSGRPIGDPEEMGAAALHALTSADVRAFDDALSAITAEDFAQRFDPRAMLKAKIYPEVWDDDELEYLAECFEDLRSGVRAAREKGVGLVTYTG